MVRVVLRTVAWALALAMSLCAARADADPIPFVLQTGTPLHIAVDRRVAVTRVGQVITGTLAEPVYVFDRVVLPAGVAVRGHVAALERASRSARARAYLSADFSPQHRIVLQFDSVALQDGRVLAIHTVVTNATERAILQVAAAPEESGIVARARQEVAQQASEALSTIAAPGKMERLKEALINRLPYHRQYLRKGTIFTAELVAPIDFGMAEATPRAAPGTRPAPESILSARLLTPLDSEKTTRGTAIRAVVTHPVFSAAHELIMPEGMILEGVVTFVRPARHFHRNGQLRFLFQTVHPPDRDPTTLLASLYAVRVNEADQIVVDEEGGTSGTSSKTRFIAPALAMLALRAATHRGLDEPDEPGQIGLPPQVEYGNPVLGGFFGWGLAGAAVSQLARPVGIGLSIVGVARTVYGSVFGKGHNVVFPADTPIELQLAPARSGGAPQP